MVSHSTKHEQALCMPTCTHLYEWSRYNVVNIFHPIILLLFYIILKLRHQEFRTLRNIEVPKIIVKVGELLITYKLLTYKLLTYKLITYKLLTYKLITYKLIN